MGEMDVQDIEKYIIAEKIILTFPEANINYQLKK
jgi:hypothetical protein